MQVRTSILGKASFFFRVSYHLGRFDPFPSLVCLPCPTQLTLNVGEEVGKSCPILVARFFFLLPRKAQQEALGPLILS